MSSSTGALRKVDADGLLGTAVVNQDKEPDLQIILVHKNIDDYSKVKKSLPPAKNQIICLENGYQGITPKCETTITYGHIVNKSNDLNILLRALLSGSGNDAPIGVDYADIKTAILGSRQIIYFNCFLSDYNEAFLSYAFKYFEHKQSKKANNILCSIDANPEFSLCDFSECSDLLDSVVPENANTVKKVLKTRALFKGEQMVHLFLGHDDERIDPPELKRLIDFDTGF